MLTSGWCLSSPTGRAIQGTADAGVLKTGARGLSRRTNPLCPTCGAVPDTKVEGQLVQTPGGRHGLVTYLRFPCSTPGCGEVLDLLPGEVKNLARIREVGKVGHLLHRMDGWLETTEAALLVETDGQSKASLVKALLALSEAKFKVAALEEKKGEPQQAQLLPGHLYTMGGPIDDALGEVAQEVLSQAPRATEPPIRDAEFSLDEEPAPTTPTPPVTTVRPSAPPAGGVPADEVMPW